MSNGRDNLNKCPQYTDGSYLFKFVTPSVVAVNCMTSDVVRAKDQMTTINILKRKRFGKVLYTSAYCRSS